PPAPPPLPAPAGPSLPAGATITMTTTTGPHRSRHDRLPRTDPHPSDAGIRSPSRPPTARYRRGAGELHPHDADAPPGPPRAARPLIPLPPARCRAPPAQHIAGPAVPGLAGKNIIDLLLAAN